MKTAWGGLVLCCVAAAILGCSDNHSSDTPVADDSFGVSGKLGSGYGVAYAPPKNMFELFCAVFEPARLHADVDNGIVDKVIALRCEGGVIDSYAVEGAPEASIDAEGNFTLSLETGVDWLLVLVDTSAVDNKDKFVGYVSLQVDPSNNLLMFPTSTAASGELDLGTLDQSGDEAVSSNPADAADFSMTADELLSLAKNDDLFKMIKNVFNNYNDGVYYNLRPNFKWNGDYAGIENVFQDPAGYVYQAYDFQLDSNDGVTIDDVAGTNDHDQVSMELYPPSDVGTTNSETIYGVEAPIANVALGDVETNTEGYQEVSSADYGFYAGEGDWGLAYGFGGGSLAGAIPEGYWEYKVDGVTLGEFDCAVATPLAPDDKIYGFVPSIRVNTDEAGMITTIDIKWYSLVEGVYVEVDPSVVKYMARADFFIENNFGERRYDAIDLNEELTSATPNFEWYYGFNGSADLQAEGIGIFYNTAGVGHYFSWFREDEPE
ncbi:MAG: hypothetical protein A2Z34_09950 [Planctomycetes bacterium RBG_16_59_8]|nr:MAG: hypothetical protein A2Z34_09950 [Planctomycetes bacterium RBG_16_59_8]